MIPFLSRLTRSDSPPARPSPRRFRAGVDALEDRRLLTLYINQGSLVVTPNQTLWPPNGRYVQIHVSGTATERHYTGGNGPPPIMDLPGPKIGQFHVTDQYRQINPSGVFPVNDLGGGNFSFSFSFYVQAKRSTEFATGRHYFVQIGLEDSDGWAGHTIAIWVPKTLAQTSTTTVTTAAAAKHAK